MDAAGDEGRRFSASAGTTTVAGAARRRGRTRCVGLASIRGVLLIKYLQRLPISKPMSPRHSYGTANLAKTQLTVVAAFRRKWSPKTPRSGLRAVCAAAFLLINASARGLGYANTRAGVNDVQRRRSRCHPRLADRQ